MASSDASQLAGAFDRRLALQGSLSCCWGFLAMTFADPTTGAATKPPAGLESAGEADAAGDAHQLSAGSADARSDAAQLPADAGDGPPTPFQLRAEDVIAIQNADGALAPAQEAEAAQNAEPALGPPCALGPPQLAGALDRRLARDCRSYTREEFVHFYGQDSGMRQWEKAPRVVSSGQIPSASAPASTAHTTGTATPRPAGSECAGEADAAEEAPQQMCDDQVTADDIAKFKAFMADGVGLFLEELSF